MKGKIISITTQNGHVFAVGNEWEGYIIEKIELRRDGHIGVNRYLPDESHFLITLVSELSDKDRRYTAIPTSYQSIVFEEDKPKQELKPEVVMENID